jgi:hypothetical protein
MVLPISEASIHSGEVQPDPFVPRLYIPFLDLGLLKLSKLTFNMDLPYWKHDDSATCFAIKNKIRTRYELRNKRLGFSGFVSPYTVLDISRTVGVSAGVCVVAGMLRGWKFHHYHYCG